MKIRIDHGINYGNQNENALFIVKIKTKLPY